MRLKTGAFSDSVGFETHSRFSQVPVIRNAESLDIAGLELAVADLGRRAKANQLAIEDMTGGTFTVSNGGVFGSLFATPIINPPCVCIVAAGKTRHEVVPVLGGVEVHRIMPLSLTFDHRACTGGEAARFLKAMLEDLARPN